jgi:hypothetical protein
MAFGLERGPHILDWPGPNLTSLRLYSQPSDLCAYGLMKKDTVVLNSFIKTGTVLN